MQMPASSKNIVWPSLAAASGGAIWGLYWLPIRQLEESGVSPAWATLMAFGVIGVVSGGLFAVRWTRVRQVQWGVVVTGIISGGSMVTYATAFVLTDVVKAILLLYLMPVWTTFLGKLILNEKITTRRIFAVALGLAGLFVILEVADGIPRPSNAGDWLALLSGFLWAWATIRIRQDTNYTALEQVGGFYIGGGLASAVAVALPIGMFGSMPATEVLIGAAPWLAIFTAVYLPFVFLIFWSSQRLSPTRVGLLLMTEVIFGVVSAALLAGEVFGWRQSVGVVLITGAALVEVTGKVEIAGSRHGKST